MYLAMDEELPYDEEDEDNRQKEVMRLAVKNWASADELDRIKCRHHFSRQLHPSKLLEALCEVLISLGLTDYTIPS